MVEASNSKHNHHAGNEFAQAWRIGRYFRADRGGGERQNQWRGEVFGEKGREEAWVGRWSRCIAVRRLSK